MLQFQYPGSKQAAENATQGRHRHPQTEAEDQLRSTILSTQVVSTSRHNTSFDDTEYESYGTCLGTGLHECGRYRSSAEAERCEGQKPARSFKWVSGSG
jgi:hypothetical protein